MTGPEQRSRQKLPVPPAVIAWGAAALAIIAGIYWAVASGTLTWSMAVDAREAGRAFVAGYAPLAYSAYVALFVAMALALFPAQLWIIVFGAMLFGFWQALIVSWLATVFSAFVVFTLARGMLAGRYRKKSGKYLARLEDGFQQNQLSWMLTMRLFPAVPYCISNVAPAVLGARTAPFLIAACIGVVPYVGAYTFAGDRASAVLNSDTPPDLGRIASDMLPILVAIAVMPVVALLVRRFGSRKPNA